MDGFIPVLSTGICSLIASESRNPNFNQLSDLQSILIFCCIYIVDLPTYIGKILLDEIHESETLYKNHLHVK